MDAIEFHLWRQTSYGQGKSLTCIGVKFVGGENHVS